MDLPFPKSWWVEPGLLLAGCFPGDIDAKVAKDRLIALLDLGILCVICLQEEDEIGRDRKKFPAYQQPLQELALERGTNIHWQRFPVQDMSTPSHETMREIVDLINQMLTEEKPVYLHCWGGHGRTGTVVGCFLRDQGMSYNQAVAEIKKLRKKDSYLKVRPSPQTSIQLQMIQDWPAGQNP